MKIAPVTKLAALLTLSAVVALTGCTLQDDDDQIAPNIPTGFEDDSSESDEIGKIYGMKDFTYVTKDGTTVQCISAPNAEAISCDWEGATRSSDTEDSAPEESAEPEENAESE